MPWLPGRGRVYLARVRGRALPLFSDLTRHRNTSASIFFFFSSLNLFSLPPIPYELTTSPRAKNSLWCGSEAAAAPPALCPRGCGTSPGQPPRVSECPRPEQIHRFMSLALQWQLGVVCGWALSTLEQNRFVIPATCPGSDAVAESVRSRGDVCTHVPKPEPWPPRCFW